MASSNKQAARSGLPDNTVRPHRMAHSTPASRVRVRTNWVWRAARTGPIRGATGSHHFRPVRQARPAATATTHRWAAKLTVQQVAGLARARRWKTGSAKITALLRQRVTTGFPSAESRLVRLDGALEKSLLVDHAHPPRPVFFLCRHGRCPGTQASRVRASE